MNTPTEPNSADRAPAKRFACLYSEPADILWLEAEIAAQRASAVKEAVECITKNYLFADTARTLQCFTLCPKCNKESEIPMGITNHEMNSNSHACPHCKTVIQTWVRVAARAALHPATKEGKA